MPGKHQTFIHPMLAREVREPFSDELWLYEVKWDGYRAIAELRGDNVRLYSRNGQPFNDTYPELVGALRSLRLDAVLDGEIVALDPAGRSNIRLLEQYGSQPMLALRFQVFDLLYKDGHCLEEQPLLWRKQLLKTILPPGDRVRYNDHVRGNGLGFFQEAIAGAREGIMGKRADSPYSEGKRSSDWLKIKTHPHPEAEAIILGVVDGALLLGRYQGDRLRFAGRVQKGVGSLSALEWVLRPLVRKTAPIKGIAQDGFVTWLRPTLVCTIRYSGLDSNGHFQDPQFKGIRMDKSATDLREG